MRYLGHYFAVALLSGIPATIVWAEEQAAAAAPASLTMKFSGLRWVQSTVKQSDEENKSELTTLTTADLTDAVIWASAGKVNVYFYPFQDSNALVSLGYMLRDDLELGVNLGLNARRVKTPKSDLSSDLFGGFVTWITPTGDFTFEHTAVLDYKRTEFTVINVATAEEETTKISGAVFKIGTSLFVPIAKNAWYTAGIWAAAENGKDRTADTTTKRSLWGVTLAGLRLTLD